MTTKNTTNATNPEHMKRAIIEAFLYRLLSVDSALDFNTEDRTVLAQNEFESLYHQDLRILLSDYAEHFDLARTLRADQIDHRAFSKLPADLTRLLETQTPPSSKTRFLTRDFEDCRALYIDETTPLCEKVESDILPPESFIFKDGVDREILAPLTDVFRLLNQLLFLSKTENAEISGELDMETVHDAIEGLHDEITAEGLDFDEEFYNEETETAGRRAAYLKASEIINELKKLTVGSVFYTLPIQPTTNQAWIPTEFGLH